MQINHVSTFYDSFGGQEVKTFKYHNEKKNKKQFKFLKRKH